MQAASSMAEKLLTNHAFSITTWQQQERSFERDSEGAGLEEMP